MTHEEGHAAMLAMVSRAHDRDRVAVTAAAQGLLHRLGPDEFVERVTLRISGEKPDIVHELLVDGELAWRGADVLRGSSWRWHSEYAPKWKPPPITRDG